MLSRPVSLIAGMLLLSGALAAATPAKVDFARDIQPLLKERCVECHGPSQQMRGLRLDRRRGPMPNRVGANGAVVVPGDSSRSVLYLKLIGKRPGLTMPPTGALTPEQIDLLKTWIDQGAEWPDQLSGETSSATPDPAVVRLNAALRSGDRRAFKKLLLADTSAINKKGPRGDTPLTYAALYGDADSVRLLLDQGADPNLVNEAGATALIYAVDDAEKTRLLLEHKANPNTRSGEGRTALLLAAARSGSGPVVKLLLDHGADVSLNDATGRTVLTFAATSGDIEPLQLLLDRGASKQPLPLAETLAAGCSRCFDLLLKSAAPADLNRALGTSVAVGDLAAMNLLLERGAVPDRNVLQNSVLIPQSLPPATIATFLERGKQANAGAFLNGNWVDLARRQGKTDLAEALLKAGAKADTLPIQAVPAPKPAESPRGAIQRSVPLLQRADVTFFAKSGCISCHNNSLTAMTLTTARSAGIKLKEINETTERGQIHTTSTYLDSNRERALEGLGIPGGPDTVGYVLLGLVAEKFPSDEVTDAYAMYLRSRQLADGRVARQALRPPLEASDIEVTAIAMRIMQVYAPPSRKAEYAKAVQLSEDWLQEAQARSTGDLVFQLLGLVWNGGDREAIRKVAGKLLPLQRPDGGWSQTPLIASDAYATGQALYALNQARVLAADSPAYQRGIRFLLNSQLEDGSWHVATRTTPVQPYFESDFPHGPDQFISAAATNWAAMALVPAAR